MNLSDMPYPLVRLRARDWSLTGDQARADGHWAPMVGYVSGWLISETEDSIAVAQQLFYRDGDEAHWQARGTVTIPKETIVQRIDTKD